ncbi:hypothetical protein QEN19_000251 [Hanseniaspora menglaensis]
MSTQKISKNCNSLFPMVFQNSSLKKAVISKNIIYYSEDQKDPYVKTSEKIDIFDLPINKILPIENSTSSKATTNSKPKTNVSGLSVILKTLAFPLNPSDKNQIDGVYGAYAKKIFLTDKEKPFSVAGNEGLFQINSFVDSEGNVQDAPEEANIRIGDFIVPRINNSGTWCTFKTIKYDQIVSQQSNGEADYVKIPAVDTSYCGNIRGFGILEATTASVNGCTAYWFKKEFERLAAKDHKTSKTKNYYAIANAGNSQVVKIFNQIVKSQESNENYNLKTVAIVRDRETPEATDKFIAHLKESTHSDIVITETQSQNREFKTEFKKMVDFDNSNIIMGLNAVGGSSARGIESKLSNDGTVFTYGGMSLKGITASTTAFIFRNIKYLGLWITKKFDQNKKLKLSYLFRLRALYNSGHLHLDPNDYEVIVWDVKNDSDSKILKKISVGLELKGKKPIVFVKHERKN